MRTVSLTIATFGATMLFSGAAHAQAATSTTTTRHYDCTKPGNANKAACKGSAASAPTAPATISTTVTKTSAARHYDCTKPGNANKAACKTAAATAVPAPAPAAPAAASTHTVQTSHTVHTTSSGGSATNPAGPNGATAQCKDGTYSHSAHRSGTCAGHKGVQTWY